MNFELLVGAWAQADEPCDEWIGESGMIVVVPRPTCLFLAMSMSFAIHSLVSASRSSVDPVNDAAARELDVLREDVVCE